MDNQEALEELRRFFPKAAKMVDRADWEDDYDSDFRLEGETDESVPIVNTSLLVDKGKSTNSPSEAKEVDSDGNNEEDPENDEQDDLDVDEPFEEGEDVLVESKCGKILWDAKVIAVAQDPSTEKVTGYRVHYLYWSTRFDEWVEPFRVVEPNENNLTVQEDLLEDILTAKEGIPDMLNRLVATQFLHASDRSRGPNCALPQTGKVVVIGPGASPDDKAIALLKAALLIIESALPLGAVDCSLKGAWNPTLAASWRSCVQETKSLFTLMGCLVLMEDALSEKWMNPQSFQLLTCLQRHWKAVSDATVSSLWLRVWLLDSSIKYDYVNKNRKGSSNKRRQTR